MSLIKVNKNENPYDVIGNYIEKHVPVIDDVIAVISINNKIYNELLLVEITTESNFIWQRDWWEGEKSVELVDFFFVSNACKRCDNNDLISRQAAINEANAWLLDCLKVNKQDRSCGLIRRLEDLPSAEPKRGKWIRDGHHIRCDQCGMYMCDTDREGDKIPNNFCPNCGMKMEEKQNDQ